jgi:hypothetical protein
MLLSPLEARSCSRVRKSARSSYSASAARATLARIGKSIELGDDKYIIIGRLHFLVESATEDDCWYCIDLEPVDDGELGGCTCTSFRSRGRCRHYDALTSFFGLAENLPRE